MLKYERDRLYWRFSFLFILSIFAWGIFLIIP